jgi:hypothetical protein
MAPLAKPKDRREPELPAEREAVEDKEDAATADGVLDGLKRLRQKPISIEEMERRLGLVRHRPTPSV